MSRALRLGTRASALALGQARRVAERLARGAVHVELVEITTPGDRDLARPIDDLPSESPVTDDIEAALRNGQIDLAVHSLKDMPLGQHPEVVARLVRELSAWRRTVEGARLKPDSDAEKALSKEELERLRALGYIQ